MKRKVICLILAAMIFCLSASFENHRFSFGGIFGSGSKGSGGSTGLSEGMENHLRLVRKGWNFEEYIGNPDNRQIVRVYPGPKYFCWDGEWLSLEWEEDENSFTVLVPYSKDGTPAKYVIEKSGGTLRGERPLLRVEQESTKGENCRLVSRMDWVPIFSEVWKFWADNQELRLQGVKWKNPQENEKGIKFGFEADLVSGGKYYASLKLDYRVNGRVKYNVELKSAVQATYTLELCTEVVDGAFFSSKYLGKIENLHLGPENLVPQITILDNSLTPLFCLSFHDLAPWDRNTRKFDMSKVKQLEIRREDSISLLCRLGDFELQADEVARLDPTVTVTPCADAYVWEYEPTSNYGASSDLIVCAASPAGNWRGRSFLKFDISSIPREAQVLTAKLHLFASSHWYTERYPGEPEPTDVSVEICEVSNDSWSESTITWQNQPEMGSAIATLPWKNGWVENEITDWVKANLSDGLVSIALRMGPEFHEREPGVSYYSKEYDGYDPYLEIEYTTPSEFEDNFDEGLIRWNLFGEPQPRTFQDPSFLDGWGYSTGGDGWYSSGSFSKQLIDMTRPFELEFRVKQGAGYVWDMFYNIGVGAIQSGYTETNIPVYFSVGIYGVNPDGNEAGTDDIVYNASGSASYVEDGANDHEFHVYVLRYFKTYVEFYRDWKHVVTLQISAAPSDKLPLLINGRDYHGTNFLDYIVVRPVTPGAPPPSDTTPPVSSVDPIRPYWQTGPFTVTVTATDDRSGVSRVELWYRFSPDNSSWSSWENYGTDNSAPWSWTFTAPRGDGYYEFYSIATDQAGNREQAPSQADACCGFDSTPPESHLSPVEPYCWVEGSLEIETLPLAGDNLSGLRSVELWYRYSRDNSTWSEFLFYSAGELALKWIDGQALIAHWRFTPPKGCGYYEFYSVAKDHAGNAEPPKPPEARCQFYGDMLIVTNKKKLVEFAKSTGESDPAGRVGDFLTKLRGMHPEGILICLEDSVSNPENWEQIDRFIDDFTLHRLEIKYLMIVGGHEVVPFCVVPDLTGDEPSVATDLYYGDLDFVGRSLTKLLGKEGAIFRGDGYQDLATGRIVSKSLEGMLKLVSRANPECYRSSENAFVSVGDADLESKGEAMANLLREHGFKVDLLRHDTVDWRSEFKQSLPNKAAIIHEGHGSYAVFSTKYPTWSNENYLYSEDIYKTGLGDTNPWVLATGCQNAAIENGLVLIDEGGRPYTVNLSYAISLQFIENGASAYVGSTRYTYFNSYLTFWSDTLALSFLNDFLCGKDAGTALRDTKNAYWLYTLTSPTTPLVGGRHLKTLQEFVLYGNPKLTPFIPTKTSNGKAQSIGSSVEIVIDISEYSRRVVGGYDVISVPSGQLTGSEGLPVIPILVKTFKLSENEVLAGIRVKEAEFERIENVRLLILNSIYGPQFTVPLAGLYPGCLYEARIYYDSDGTRTLNLVIAPLQYDNKNGIAYLYKHLKLELTASRSAVFVYPFNWHQSASFGDNVQQKFSIVNSGPNVLEINLQANGEISKYLSFDKNSFSLLPGQSIEITARFSASELGSHTGEIIVSADNTLIIPVAISVFAPPPKVELTKDFTPAEVPEGRGRGIVVKDEIVNVNPVPVENLELVDELPTGWKTHSALVSVWFIDNENKEYLVDRDSFALDVSEGRLSLRIRFGQGVKLHRGLKTKIIKVLSENERIVMKYLMASLEELVPGLLETKTTVMATSPMKSTFSDQWTHQLEVKTWEEWIRDVRSELREDLLELMSKISKLVEKLVRS